MNNIRIFDDVLGNARREEILQFLNSPGENWVHGATSSPDPQMPKYFYKHFAGFRQSGLEDMDPRSAIDELQNRSPILYEFWKMLSVKILHGHMLSRCYANAMPPGIGGGVHKDSPHHDHLTAIYYPQSTWNHDEGGETLFFNQSISEIKMAVAPKPDRLVVFSGTIPHVARPVYRTSHTPRITLMYKTLGRAKAPSRPGRPAP
ncbi:2OG-Fe(II) oxygenase [Novosphingobium sp. G106]|nr:2OG-Fe(II) oxygenase [Novosphingobium sp. G106]